jgi:hypothetical protein
VLFFPRRKLSQPRGYLLLLEPCRMLQRRIGRVIYTWPLSKENINISVYNLKALDLVVGTAKEVGRDPKPAGAPYSHTLYVATSTKASSPLFICIQHVLQTSSLFLGSIARTSQPPLLRQTPRLSADRCPSWLRYSAR